MSTPLLSSETSDTLRCARHPDTETVLRCGRCETPICPRCFVQTPVGARCPTCAQVKRLSILLKPVDLARAVGYGVVAGAVGTAIFTLIPFLGPFISYAIVGFGVGEAVSVGANRKRVRELAPIAVACLFLGYWLGLVILLAATGEALGPRLLLAPILALRGGAVLIGLLIGALLAWMRAR
jgi:hypothetical protein